MTTQCKAGAMLKVVPRGDRKLLARLLAGGKDDRGRDVPATTLAKVLTGVSATTIKDHRGGRCVCAHPEARS